MTSVATQVLATVNAPYGTNLSVHQLAAMIADPKCATDFSAPVFAFFSEVSPALQKQFVKGMGVDEAKVSEVVSQLSELSGHALPLVA